MPPTQPISVGSPAIGNTGNGASAGDTVLDINHPCLHAGVITSVDLWSYSDLANAVVAIFEPLGGGDYKCRSRAYLGHVASGSKQTVSVTLTIQAGDVIGYYCSSGLVWETPSGSGGAGIAAHTAGDETAIGTIADYGASVDRAISLQGSGVGPLGVQVQQKLFQLFPIVSQVRAGLTGEPPIGRCVATITAIGDDSGGDAQIDFAPDEDSHYIWLVTKLALYVGNMGNASAIPAELCLFGGRGQVTTDYFAAFVGDLTLPAIGMTSYPVGQASPVNPVVSPIVPVLLIPEKDWPVSIVFTCPNVEYATYNMSVAGWLWEMKRVLGESLGLYLPSGYEHI